MGTVGAVALLTLLLVTARFGTRFTTSTFVIVRVQNLNGTCFFTTLVSAATVTAAT